MDTITTTHKHHHPKPAQAKIYLIRHGEKPSKLPSGEDAPGLSSQGLQRAQGLISVFSPTSIYALQHIIAQHPHKHEKEARPYETILPLSQSLNLTPNTDVERDDAQGAADLCLKLAETGNVLVCWEHAALGKIVKALGAGDDVVYPGERFDVIWLVWDKNGDGKMVLGWVGSEGIPGLDDKWKGDSGGPLLAPGPVIPPTFNSENETAKTSNLDVSVEETHT